MSLFKELERKNHFITLIITKKDIPYPLESRMNPYAVDFSADAARQSYTTISSDVKKKYVNINTTKHIMIICQWLQKLLSLSILTISLSINY